MSEKTWPARDVIKQCCDCKKAYDDCTKPFMCMKSTPGDIFKSEWACYDCSPGYAKFLAQAEADGR